MRDLSPRARQMLDAARAMDEPADVDRARNRRTLAATLAAGVVTASGSGGAAAISIGKVTLLLTVVAVGVGGGVWLGARAGRDVPRTSPPATVVPARTATPPAPPPAIEATPITAPVPMRAPTPPRRARPHAPAPTPTQNAALAQEIGLLGQANAALRDGDPSGALALLAEHDRRFPGSTLREEVQATRLIARCQQSPARAAAAVRAFLSQHAASPLAPRVARACGQKDQGEDYR